MKYKTIGILGGMGPEASAKLYLEIIRIFQNKFGAKYDDDFPEIFIYNLPLPDVVENSSVRNIVKDRLIYGVRKLEKIGADFIVVPCNTVETYFNDLRNSVDVPVISIVNEIFKSFGNLKLGLIATEKTIEQGIYSKRFYDVIIPNKEDQKITTRIIMNILSGKFFDKDRERLVKIVNKMKKSGAAKVILGCTDLPLLLTSKNTIDTIKVLAEAAVRETQNLINNKTITESEQYD
ncbi:MAG TPA: amino acid racemase [Candidatus Nanoarchaeia archaeon]|nr:amino acid racemase [Candidatus Nanoarchaeia archaeon]